MPAAMRLYIPPHKRLEASHSRPLNKIIYGPGCFFRWFPFPPFSSGDSLRLESFPGDPIERNNTSPSPFPAICADRFVLVQCSSREAASASGDAANAAAIIVDRFLPQLLAAVERTRAMTHDLPKEIKDELKLSLVARVGNIIFHHSGGSPAVTLDSLRDAAKAGEEGSRRRIGKTFYTNVTTQCYNHMKQSAVKMMEPEFDLSRQHYRVMVFDNHRSDSEISCKCTVQDGKLANHKIELKGIRELVEDISCVSKDLDLRLMLSTKRTLQNLDAEETDAIETLISSAVVDPNVKWGLTWPFGEDSIGDRFSIVGVWRTKYEAFRNETLRLKLSAVERFDLVNLTEDPVSNEVTFKLKGINKKLEDGDLEVDDTLKEMLEDAVGMIWNNALNYKTTP